MSDIDMTSFDSIVTQFTMLQ